MVSNQDIIGIGWHFPPQFDLKTRSVVLVSDKTDIEQSLEILFSTSLGERVMQAEYGCNLEDYQYETVSTTFLTQLRSHIERAILYHEPRILLENLDITAAEDPELLEGKLRIFLDYSIAGTNSRYNLVYDLYLREADNNPLVKLVS